MDPGAVANLGEVLGAAGDGGVDDVAPAALVAPADNGGGVGPAVEPDDAADGGDGEPGALEVSEVAADDVEMTECPICCDMKNSVKMLVHRGQNKDAADPGSEVVSRTLSGRNTSEHKACKECQEQMVAKGQSCPWCRDEVRTVHAIKKIFESR
jgi:hypothetical protein